MALTELNGWHAYVLDSIVCTPVQTAQEVYLGQCQGIFIGRQKHNGGIVYL